MLLRLFILLAAISLGLWFYTQVTVICMLLGIVLLLAYGSWAGSKLPRLLSSEPTLAQLPIDQCHVRGCKYHGEEIGLSNLRLCPEHGRVAGYDEKTARRKFQIVSNDELESLTVNPFPFSRVQLGGNRHEHGDWLANAFCPQCKNPLQADVPMLELMKDLVGEATTLIDGRVMPGVIVICASCCRLWRLKPKEAIRRRPDDNPVGEVRLDSVGVTPMSHLEEFPFGCPECERRKSVVLRVPDSILLNQETKRPIYYRCSDCSKDWLVWFRNDCSPSWAHHYKDNSVTAYMIEDCRKCGRKRSCYRNDSRQSRSHYCRACGDKGHEFTD